MPLPTRFAAAVASVTGNLFLLLGSLVLGALGIVVGLVPPRTFGTFYLMKIWSRGLLRASGCRVRAVLDGELDPARGYVFLANHQSLFDIPAVLATVPQQVRFAAKRTLFRIPIFGWALYAGGFIPVDRGVGSKAQDTFAAARTWLVRGVSVLFFPEGTRSTDGRVAAFQRGGFLLALKENILIVPVGIAGTIGIQRRGSFAIHPREVTVSYGKPIDPAEFGVRRRAELEHRVRSEVARLAGAELRGKVDEVPEPVGTSE
jgi:1-acyl-sn-glycerol-3-phosphate acyltransferase